MPEKHQILMGSAIAALCLLGLWQSRWFMHSTRKGQRLRDWLGDERALSLLQVLFALGAAFGVLLATNVIRPVQW